MEKKTTKKLLETLVGVEWHKFVIPSTPEAGKELCKFKVSKVDLAKPSLKIKSKKRWGVGGR